MRLDAFEIRSSKHCCQLSKDMRINVHSNRQLRPTCLTAGMQELHILNWLCFLRNYFSPTLSKRLDCTPAGPSVLQNRMSFTMQIVAYTRRELHFASNSEIVKLMLAWKPITVKWIRMLANRWESPRRSASVHIQSLLLSTRSHFTFLVCFSFLGHLLDETAIIAAC